MEFIPAADIQAFSKAGITSRQLLFPENSNSARVTATHVTISPGAKNLPHRHPASEQVWIALHGEGQLLLEDGNTMPFCKGDVVRFADGDLHGFENTGTFPFEYLSVTSPPVNFRHAYEKNEKPTEY